MAAASDLGLLQQPRPCLRVSLVWVTARLPIQWETATGDEPAVSQSGWSTVTPNHHMPKACKATVKVPHGKQMEGNLSQ